MAALVTSLDELKSFLSRCVDTLIILEFYSRNCEPCKELLFDFNRLVKEHNEVIFLRTDVDNNEDIATEYQVKAWPTFIFFKDGEIIDKYLGSNMDMLNYYIIRHK